MSPIILSSPSAVSGYDGTGEAVAEGESRSGRAAVCSVCTVPRPSEVAFGVAADDGDCCAELTAVRTRTTSCSLNCFTVTSPEGRS